jgi:hypothetical protein
LTGDLATMLSRESNQQAAVSVQPESSSCVLKADS